MPYRRFMDSEGKGWRVWDVVPTLIERRIAIRRLRALKIFHAERRFLPTRRIDMQRSYLYFPPTETGWLCFESDSAKRRLRPIPDGWAHAGDEALEDFCQRAAPDADPSDR